MLVFSYLLEIFRYHFRQKYLNFGRFEVKYLHVQTEAALSETSQNLEIFAILVPSTNIFYVFERIHTSITNGKYTKLPQNTR